MEAAPWWPAPAKLNLFLHILGRRADGYHELQTLFQFVDYADELRFRPRSDGRIVAEGVIPGVAPADDLNLRAARLLRAETGRGGGVSIAVRKRIPMGGGLGGGSSNAATTLLVLNRLWDCGLERGELARLGLRLGADVPIFVHGQAAWAEGVGERIQPVAPPEPWYLVVTPDCHVPTAEIFAAPDLTRDHRPTTIRSFLAGEVADNDCVAAVTRRYPPVAEALAWLADESEGDARMSGTGASVFAAFDDEARARESLARMPSRYTGFVARGANVSLLHRRLREAGLEG